jgi:hypothetical protein
MILAGTDLVEVLNNLSARHTFVFNFFCERKRGALEPCGRIW